jgi:crotonobetainyl-CoA:carnitine CoA-transferase CaiB-like acyl-CoA transferase
VEQLATDTRFALNPARIQNREVLIEKLGAITRTRSSSEWTTVLREAQVPCGPVQSIDEVFDDPQVKARDMVVNVEHPLLGSVPTIANPIKYSLTPLEYDAAPPLLGEHTENILAEYLGIDAAELADLRTRGVV